MNSASGSCPTMRDWARINSLPTSQRTYDATLRNIELIGEAATHVPGHVRKDYPDIPWRRIVGIRNRVAHGYLGIDDDVVWDVIQVDVPDLLPRLRTVLQDARSEGP